MLLEKGVFSGGNTMNRLLSGVSAGVIMLACAMGAAKAADLPGKFEGVTIDAKLIGGQQYEKLYERIGEWEKATGAKVNILSKKNHFELDKEIKSDIATGGLTCASVRIIPPSRRNIRTSMRTSSASSLPRKWPNSCRR